VKPGGSPIFDAKPRSRGNSQKVACAIAVMVATQARNTAVARTP
jgi:hypothetical protein